MYQIETETDKKPKIFQFSKFFYAIFVKFSTDFVDWNVEKSQQGTNLLSSSLFRRDLGRKISRWSAGVLLNVSKEKNLSILCSFLSLSKRKTFEILKRDCCTILSRQQVTEFCSRRVSCNTIV